MADAHDWETADLDDQFHPGFLADLFSEEEFVEIMAMILVGRGIGVDTREMLVLGALAEFLFPEIADLADVRCDYEEECNYCRSDSTEAPADVLEEEADGGVVVAAD
jgi:hypothetical protein